jgi:hypothetical protein
MLTQKKSFTIDLLALVMSEKRYVSPATALRRNQTVLETSDRISNDNSNKYIPEWGG